MILVPRQIRMTGMTGSVPYYGGRFTPAQAYAAARPGPRRVPDREVTVERLQGLLDDGVITQDEHDELTARLRP